MSESKSAQTHRYPLVACRDVVVFPYMMVPFVIGRPQSVLALESALKADKKVVAVTQKDSSQDQITPDDLYEMGTLVSIVQSLKLPDGNIRIMVEGQRRVRRTQVRLEAGFFQADVTFEPTPRVSHAKTTLLTKKLNQIFERFAKLNPNINYESIVQSARSTDADRLSDTIAANLPIVVEDKQALLEEVDPSERMEKICEFIEIEIEKIKLDKSIQGRVRRSMEKAQREYYLQVKLETTLEELERLEKESPVPPGGEGSAVGTEESIEEQVRQRIERDERAYYLREKIKAIQKELGLEDAAETGAAPQLPEETAKRAEQVASSDAEAGGPQATPDQSAETQASDAQAVLLLTLCFRLALAGRIHPDFLVRPSKELLAEALKEARKAIKGKPSLEKLSDWYEEQLPKASPHPLWMAWMRANWMDDLSRLVEEAIS